MNKEIKSIYRHIKNTPVTQAALILTSIFSVAAFGMSEKMFKVDDCVASVTRFVTAEFSQYHSSVCVNMDGEIEDCSYWDYWSEPASNVSSATFVNDAVVYPEMPKHDLSMKSLEYFDRFKKQTNTNLTVFISLMGESDSFTDGIGKNKECIDNRDNVIIVNTWYGITYSSEF